MEQAVKTNPHPDPDEGLGESKTGKRHKISMRGFPILSSGGRTIPMGSADNLWVHGKIYSDGGENALHAHTREDHVFFIVQGKARFYFDDGHTEVADTYEGFLLPKGTVYRFESIGEGNLIILRVGGAQLDSSWSGEFQKGWPREMRETSIVDGKGEHIKDMRSAQKGPLAVQPTIAIPGRSFPEN